MSLSAPPKLGRRFPKLADGAQKVMRLKFCAPPLGKKFDLAPSCQGVGPGINGRLYFVNVLCETWTNEGYILGHILPVPSRVKIYPFFLIWLYGNVTTRLGMMDQF